MKHKASRIVALIILYTVIIFGIFMLQFTIGKTFSYKIGSINISGRHNVDDEKNPQPLLPLHIISNGLNFYVTEQSPIIIEQSGKNIPLKILKYEKKENSFKIHCSENVDIIFSLPIADIEDSIKIQAFMPDSAKKLYFPWKLTPTARLERNEKNIFLIYGKQRFVFKGGSGFKSYKENPNSEFPQLILYRNKPTAYYEAFIKSKKMDFESIPDNRMASNETYNTTIKNFEQTAISYFEKAISSKNYGEKLVTAYLAEKAKLGEYEDAIRIAPGKQLARQEKTYISSPFYNNLQKNNALLIKQNYKELKEVSRLIDEGNPNIFTKYKLIPFLMDNARQRFIPKLEKIALNARYEDLNSDICIGILELSLDYSRFYPNKKNKLQKVLPQCTKKINDSLLFIDDGLYISSNGKSIDTRKTLNQAGILMRYGKEQANKKIWRFVGQMLFSSILNFSGESASIPAFFNIQRNNNNEMGLMANDNLILHADQLYPLVMNNSNYPHRESLSLQSEPGVWAWTVANKISIIENTAKMFRFKVSFKKGQAHYLIIRGIRPFYRIKIYGVNYKSDPRFENYKSSGYIYDSKTRSLLLKLQHKQDTEEIALFLGRPPQPKPLPVPTTPEATENTEGTNADGAPENPIHIENIIPGATEIPTSESNNEEGNINDSQDE